LPDHRLPGHRRHPESWREIDVSPQPPGGTVRETNADDGVIMTIEPKTFTQLVELVEGRLDADATVRLLEAIDAEPELARAHVWLVQLISPETRPVIMTPSSELRIRLQGLLPEVPTANPVRDAAARIVTAIGRLVRDVHAAPGLPAIAGARNVSTSTSRELMFELDGDTDLMLTLAVGTARFELSGQVLGATNALTIVLNGDDGTRTVDADEFGEFQVSYPVTTALTVSIVSDDRAAIVDLTDFLDLGPTSANENTPRSADQ
jgi:hypothetical protein